MERTALVCGLLVGLAGILCAAEIAWAAEAKPLVFSWTPGRPTANTAAGEVAVTPAKGARKTECPQGHALSPGEGGETARAEFDLGTIPETGTISFWIKLDRRIQTCSKDGGPVSANILDCRDMRIQLREQGNCVLVHTRGGKLVKRPRAWGAGGHALTHLRAGQWYHLALVYDGPKGTWRIILNGVLQPEPWYHGPYKFNNESKTIKFSGLMTSGNPKAKEARITLGPVTWRAGRATAKDILAQLKAIKGWALPPNRGEGQLEQVVDFDGEALGGKVLFQEKFDRPLDKDLWVPEGNMQLKVRDGRLEMHNRRDCVLWLRKKLPRDFVAAWDFQPSQTVGLAIVFFAAMGADESDLFDPKLAKRGGNFRKYINGDIRCYHCSYYAGTRGSANLRKNKGFYLVALGPDQIGPSMMKGQRGPFRVVLVRRGPRIELAVNKKRFMLFEDDSKSYGPAHGGGYMGLLQQFNTRMASYDNLVIRELKKDAK